MAEFVDPLLLGFVVTLFNFCISDCFPPGTTEYRSLPAAGGTAVVPNQRCKP